MNARLVVTPKGGVDFLFQVCVMVKTFAAFIVLVLLPACAAAPDWFPSALRDPGAGRHQHALAEFSFEWELSGSREVAPLQIFDDGQRTWLRSEEHTSELQSLMRISYAVFCLKKKNKKYITILRK